MSIISEIADWVQGQPDWMSDAVRRIFNQESLSEDDISDLASLLKTKFGFADPKERVPQLLDGNQLPAEVNDASPVSLTTIRSPKNLNAIGADGITFEPDGLTIIYGYNGAGKSGYVRALKKACRARNTENIYPNVFALEITSAPAQANFEWIVGDRTEAEDWIDDGRPSPQPLSRIAVFDSHCARVFVDDQAEVSFIPYGLDVLRELAVGLQRVQKSLEVESQNGRFDSRRLAQLQSETVVGKLIAALDHKTDPNLVQKLANLSPEEDQERQILVKLLRDEDPVKQATVIRRFTARLQALEAELTALEEPLSDEFIGTLKIVFEQLVAAETASKMASAALQDEGKALTGTGTEPWEVMVKSAMTFMSEMVYPEYEFPGPKDEAKCVLCQQPLTKEAEERLKIFVKFLEADAQKQYTKLRNEAATLYRAITAAKVEEFPTDRVLLDELNEQFPELANLIKEYISGLNSRKQAVMGMAPNRKIEELPALPNSPRGLLQQLREARNEQATKLEQSLTQDDRKAKMAKLAELESRLKLKENLELVIQAIESKKRDYAYAEAMKSCSTLAVTKKMNELYEKTVTAELQGALIEELRALGLSDGLFGLEMSGQRGARMQKLKLAINGHFAKLKSSSVLSEGEQRAIALASFLAEIRIEKDRSGIIFDDPVSSLDHIRRDRIAVRLAREAKSRQVIVFTHDLAFAWSLRDFAEKYGVKHTERHIYSTSNSKGHSQESLPFEAKKLEARVNDLRTLAAKARKALEVEQDHDTYNDIVRQGYRRMRDTWELVVEDLLFNQSVKRFRRSVETQRLSSVLVDDTDVYAISQGMTRCSCFTHEGGAEAPPPLPTPDEFSVDIEILGNTVDRIKARLKAVDERRKKEGLPA